jgi:pantoate--beta-alanine ligase
LLIFTKIAELQAFLRKRKVGDTSIGFVPTMGALHKGHVSLVERSKQQADITVCSIFVNPTQFNDKADLLRYPRMPEKDIETLVKTGCDALFMPAVEEIYPDPQPFSFDFGHLNQILEAAHRPGHFNGVAQVVKRLFEIVGPQKAFFGSKDYQQVLIVKELVKQLGLPVEVIACPSIREADGLAMSSRNTLLNTEERETAAFIPLILMEAKELALRKGIPEAKAYVKAKTASLPLMKPEYYEICDAATLLPLNHAGAGSEAISLFAAYVGRIRLIDNLILN